MASLPGDDLVTVVLPALDEAAALPLVLAGLPQASAPSSSTTVRSTGPARSPRRSAATVVHEPRRGFGSACAAGLAAATTEVVAFCDCDGSFDLAELPLVCDPVLDGSARMVLGRRVPTAIGAWPPHARLANAVLARRLRRQLGLPLRDLGPMRAARRTDWLALDVEDRRSGWPLEQVVRAGLLGWTMLEVPVAYRPGRVARRSRGRCGAPPRRSGTCGGCCAPLGDRVRCRGQRSRVMTRTARSSAR